MLIRPRGYKTFFMLSSTEHENLNAHNNGYKLIDICRNNNLYILNGRFGRDKTEGKLTFRNQSLIDYTICSFNCLKLLKDFEVIDTDPIYSDGHALLSWTINCNVLLKENSQQFQTQPTYKKWDAIHSTEFTDICQQNG